MPPTASSRSGMSIDPLVVFRYGIGKRVTYEEGNSPTTDSVLLKRRHWLTAHQRLPTVSIDKE